MIWSMSVRASERMRKNAKECERMRAESFVQECKFQNLMKFTIDKISQINVTINRLEIVAKLISLSFFVHLDVLVTYKL